MLPKRGSDMTREIEKLNDVELRRWLKANQPVAISDGGGLTFTISKNGTASWVLRYRYANRNKELTLGRYPDLSLRNARERARHERANIQKGIDVAADRQKQKRLAAIAMTFSELVADYREKVMPQLALSTAKQREQHFKAHILPTLGPIPVRDITPEDIAVMLRKTGKKSTPNVTELVLTATSEAFKHGQRITTVITNPCTGISAFAIVGRPQVVRARLKLTEEELGVLLPNLHLIGRTNQLATLILLSTCVRIGELTQAKWEDIDFYDATWRIPPEVSKSRNGFIVPLVPQVIEWFEELHTLSCGSKFVFPARQTRRLRTHGCEMPFEKRALNAMLSKLTKKLPNVRHFTPHDLRSTARSYLAALGISPIVAERCLNHSLGGLLAVYDQHDYLDERRNALEQLNAFITRCAAKKENNVPSPRQVVSLNKVFQPIN